MTRAVLIDLETSGRLLPGGGVWIDDRPLALVRVAAKDLFPGRELGMAIGVDGVHPVPFVAPDAGRATLGRAIEAPEAKIVGAVGDLEAIAPVLVDPVVTGLGDDRHVSGAVPGTGKAGDGAKPAISVL